MTTVDDLVHGSSITNSNRYLYIYILLKQVLVHFYFPKKAKSHMSHIFHEMWLICVFAYFRYLCF